MKTSEEKARTMVGDGKLPNRYFLSVSSDYAYLHKEEDANYVDYIGDIVEGWEKRYSKGGTIADYPTYEEALEAAQSDFEIGQKYNGFTVNRITIEDRLTGQVYEAQTIIDIETAKRWIDVQEDIGFTKQTMKERGKAFK